MKKVFIRAVNGKEGFCMGCFNGVYPVAAPVETVQ